MRLELAMLLLTITAVAPFARAAEEQIPEKVLQSWKDAGAEIRYVSTTGLWEEKPTPGCRVGFRFHGWIVGQSKNLLEPETPFHLEISFPWRRDEKDEPQEITDEGLKELVKFQNLRSLDVFGHTITNAGLSEIAKLQQLEDLDLSCTQVTAAGLEELSKLRPITKLSLSNMDVTEAMLEKVACFSQLEEFRLSFTKSEVKPAGIAHLAKLPKLKKADFFTVNLSDAAAIELGASKSLEVLGFLNADVTETGEAALRELLPKCDITVRKIELPKLTPPVPK